MYINNMQEARAAARIAQEYGFDVDADYFLGSETRNLFPGERTFQDVRDMTEEIHEAITALRLRRRADMMRDFSTQDTKDMLRLGKGTKELAAYRREKVLDAIARRGEIPLDFAGSVLDGWADLSNVPTSQLFDEIVARWTEDGH